MLADMFPRHVIEFIAINGTDAVPASISQLAHTHEVQWLTLNLAIMSHVCELLSCHMSASLYLDTCLQASILSHVCEPLSSQHQHQDISIFFMDIVGFTPLAKEAHPEDVMWMLDELFSHFDKLCDVHHVYKVNGNGGGYST